MELNECQRQCDSNETCKGYSYLAEEDHDSCVLYDDCDNIGPTSKAPKCHPCEGHESFKKPKPTGIPIFIVYKTNVIFPEY